MKKKWEKYSEFEISLFKYGFSVEDYYSKENVGRIFILYGDEYKILSKAKFIIDKNKE